ncbi:hypothetical protein PATY110618_09290 [Paenibacillus typhae]|uniref:Uncharacterized protein n=1 Tax=Paenibacillus typhae TaxID=1174501 RepID=A0A1G8F4L7_9BACL|nr:hypothetical protein SAMN05216192_101131 [Paenibacillus typhae]
MNAENEQAKALYTGEGFREAESAEIRCFPYEESTFLSCYNTNSGADLRSSPAVQQKRIDLSARQNDDGADIEPD